jgi:UDP-N-acetylmuramyl pentapeptide phosphotransferase/UDP-N-acetylglucosamine-1-phosphate transferase
MVFFVFIPFLLINFIYIKVWKKFSVKVPSGIGILLVIPFFFYYIEFNLSSLSSLLVLAFAILYFMDDIKGIHFSFRIILQILASFVIYFSYSLEFNFIIIFLNLFFFIILVNSLNFQDGEDLNIAVLLILIFTIFYLYSNNEVIENFSKIILLFLAAFSLFNFKKNYLYFGDSGCYIASIIIFLVTYNQINNLILIKLLIAVLFFPITDILYVIVYRFVKNENLLSRNYLHVYQILAQKTNAKLYLLPNIFFAIFNILISLNFVFGVTLILILIFTNLFFLFTVRLIIKKFTN